MTDVGPSVGWPIVNEDHLIATSAMLAMAIGHGLPASPIYDDAGEPTAAFEIELPVLEGIPFHLLRLIIVVQPPNEVIDVDDRHIRTGD